MASERVYYNEPFANIVISCEVHSDKSEDTIKAKLNEAVKSFKPFSLAVLVDEENNLKYENKGFEKNLENINFSEAGDLSILKQLAAYPFDLSNAETLKIIIHKESLGYTVYFCMHHIIADANSLILLIKRFAALMVEKNIPHVSDYTAEKNNIELDLKEKYLVDTINRHYPTKKYSREEFSEMHARLYRENELEFEKRVLIKSEIDKIKEHCKTHGVSISAYLVNELFEKQHVETVCLPVDTRVSAELFGNYVSRIDIKRRDIGKSSDENERLKAIGGLIKSKLENREEIDRGEKMMDSICHDFFDDVIFSAYTDKSVPFAKKMAKMIGFKDERPTVFVSNLKTVDFEEDESFFVTNTCFYPPHPTERLSTVGVITQKDRMIITVQKFKKLK